MPSKSSKRRKSHLDSLLASHGAPGLLERINRSSAATLMETLGIRYTDVGSNHLEATMPVGPRSHQPMGILHGGATAALVESVGSAASALHLDPSARHAVGLSLSINHLGSIREGMVIARADAVHLGRSTHVWDVRVRDESGRQIAVSRLTMMVLNGPVDK